MKNYVIGIDLGTTNCTMAYAEKEKENSSLEQCSIPQFTSAQEKEGLDTLPSFVYFPLEEEAQLLAGESRFYLGQYARERVGEIPGRGIASAKSWLCHDGIDRRQAILPMQAVEGCPTMSPVDVMQAFLLHLAQVWDETHPENPFREQEILITVPASFDPSARQLVQEAAQKADYPDIILMEEPQAAFYAWLRRHQDSWREQLSVDDTVLVVDIGGGTTDFSLIKVVDQEGDLGLERIAVGSHLLLGGDNMDLALAYHAKAKLEEQGHAIDEWQLQQLVAACRKGKEALLCEDASKSFDVTIHGRGSRLIGGTLSLSLHRDEVFQWLVDGFFPTVAPHERSTAERRGGIQELGLPYAHDARITCQLAKFLSMTGEVDSQSMDDFIQPTALLFNGGTMKAEAFRQRLVDVLNAWAKEQEKAPIKVLEGPDFDFAVSRGACTYGLARTGNAIRIKAGTSRSYFIGVEGSAPAVPGMPPPMKALCIVPFGMEEGSELSISDQHFSLTLGQAATFRFFSHATPKLSDGTEVQAGVWVARWQKELTELHPIETLLPPEGHEGTTVCVTLTSKVTELGVLELWCVAEEGRKWKLEFDLRKESPELAMKT